jgi:hypothetical protein
MATKPAAKKEARTEKLSDIVKDLYLANLGMYDKIYETLEEKVEEISDKREGLFKELVKRGEHVHKTAEKRIKDAQKDAGKFIRHFDLTKEMKLEDRIKELRSNFGSVREKLVPGASKKKAPSKTRTKAKATANKATRAAKQAAAKASS